MTEERYDHEGQSKTIAEWAHLLDIDPRELDAYVRNGNAIEDAIAECLETTDQIKSTPKLGVTSFRTWKQSFARKLKTPYVSPRRHSQMRQSKTPAEWAQAHRPRSV